MYIGEFLLLLVCFFRWQGDIELGYKPPHAAATMLVYIGLIKSLCRGPRPYWMTDKIKTLDPTLEVCIYILGLRKKYCLFRK